MSSIRIQAINARKTAPINHVVKTVVVALVAIVVRAMRVAKQGSVNVNRTALKAGSVGLTVVMVVVAIVTMAMRVAKQGSVNVNRIAQQT